MSHRGPDGINAWSERNIGIGNCMFHTTPESVGEVLPYFDKNNGLVITADARIDAREELAKKLGLYQRLKDGIPDSQLILAAYKKWQAKCVHHLLGDFAFLIWDQSQQQLFCARDHLGVKPFYYHISNNVFTAASEVRALLHVPQVPRVINEARIADFLVQQLEGIDKTSTFYSSILRLPPAHTLLVSQDDVWVNQYWELNAEAEIDCRSDEEYVEAFHEIFRESVSDRLRCTGEVSSMLSGGVDSSYIVGTARQLKQEAGPSLLSVYSGVSQSDPNCRETRCIQSVIAQGGLQSITASAENIADYKNSLLEADTSLEDPFDSSMKMVKLLYLMARDQGHRVMLDGVEGDLVHSLSASYPSSLVRRGHFGRAIKESIGVWQNYYQKQTSLLQVFNSTIRPAFMPDRLRQWRRSLFRKSILADNLHGTIINRDFAREVDIESRLKQLDSHSTIRSSASFREKQVKRIMHPYLPTGLERYDRIAALCTIEPRHPLLDKRLVEYSLSLPWDMKVRHGWSKYILRRASEPLLPADVAWRQGWDSIHWQFMSALIQQESDRLIRGFGDQQGLLNRYIHPGILKSLARDTQINALSDHEDAIWTVTQLAEWLKIDVPKELNYYV